MMSMKHIAFWLTLLGTAVSPEAAQTLELKPGDHICLVGGGLADRMQHDGWLETLLVARHPKHDLVFRNLAAAGDEVGTWHRSENFGSRDQWLGKSKADVVFAFYGFNESFKGRPGIERFKQDLARFVEDTTGKNYSGRGPARVVTFLADRQRSGAGPKSAAARGEQRSPRALCGRHGRGRQGTRSGLPGLASLSRKLFTDAAEQGRSLTFNGLHLTAEGDRQLALVIFETLYHEAPPAGDLERLRAAVNEKNAEWHARYRTMDGYNVYGGRSQITFPKSTNGVEKISNYQVMQEEMAQRDVKTENRDRRVWAVARGGDLKVDDANLPQVETLIPSKPGPNPDGSHVFLSGEEAIKHMTVARGCKVSLFASEEQFPDLASPVQMAFDTKGRLWVAAWPSYPERTPTSTVGDKLLIFEDTKGDGHADKVTTFLDDFNCPTGFQFYRDGVLVVQAPDLWFARDTRGGDKADWKERVLMGLDSADSHHTANSMVLDPGGATYLSDGVFHRTQVETANGPVRNEDACIYRFEPRTGKFERYAPYGFANPHGRVFDYWGNDIITDATGNNSYFAPAFTGYLDYPAKHADMHEFWARPARPCPGTGMLYSRHFPAEFQGNFLNCNVIGVQGIFRAKVTEEGSGLKGETAGGPGQSDDPNFRPTAVDVAPDGSIYFLDWHKPLIGHMQHHIRDPNRDHKHGRIYRITYPGRPLLKPVAIEGEPHRSASGRPERTGK